MQELGCRSIVHKIAPLCGGLKYSRTHRLAKDPSGTLPESLKGNGVFRVGRTSLTKPPDQPLAPHGDDSGSTHASGVLVGSLWNVYGPAKWSKKPRSTFHLLNW